MALTDDAISTIKDMIVSGELTPGQRLPPEKELAERLGLSRNSLREAVKSLEVMRVLDVRRGDGTYVTSLEPALLLEGMSFVIDLHHDRTVLEIFEVRRLLEPQAAAAAASRIESSVVDRLAESLDALGPSPDVDVLVAHDLEFHSTITAASGNAYLSSLLEAMASATVRARVWRGLTQDGAVQRTLSEHRAILDALRQRDADLAKAALVLHIGGVEGWIRSGLPPADAT